MIIQQGLNLQETIALLDFLEGSKNLLTQEEIGGALVTIGRSSVSSIKVVRLKEIKGNEREISVTLEIDMLVLIEKGTRDFEGDALTESKEIPYRFLVDVMSLLGHPMK